MEEQLLPTHIVNLSILNQICEKRRCPIVNKDDFVILTEISVRCDTQKQQLFDVLSKHLLQIEHTINGDRVALLEQVVVESY